MASRVGLAGALAAVCLVLGAAPALPSSGTAFYTVRADPRLCPSPMCGGHWVARVNAATTRCADGSARPECYVANAVSRWPLVDGALARGHVAAAEFGDLGRFGVLVVADAYVPAGKASAGGAYYRVVDTGIVCVRAPCFSYRARRVNGTARPSLSGVDLAHTNATPDELERADAALRSKNGLYARGRVVRGADGGRVFRASRFFLRAPKPRA
jgi:hypothetical protein